MTVLSAQEFSGTTDDMKGLLDGIKKGTNPGPTFEGGFRVQAVIDAVERSVDSRGWVTPETYRPEGGANGEA